MRAVADADAMETADAEQYYRIRSSLKSIEIQCNPTLSGPRRFVPWSPGSQTCQVPRGDWWTIAERCGLVSGSARYQENYAPEGPVLPDRCCA